MLVLPFLYLIWRLNLVDKDREQSHNTIVPRTTWFTSFNLLYEQETMLTEEIKHQSLRAMQGSLASDEAYSKDTIEGSKLEVVENITLYKQKMERQESSKEKYWRRGPHPLNKAQHRHYKQAPAKMGKSIHSKGNRKTKVLPPCRPWRQVLHSCMEHR